RAALLAAHEQLDGPERARREHHLARPHRALRVTQAGRLLDGQLVAAAASRVERAHVGDARLGEDLGAPLLGQVEVVLVEGVLGAVPAADHASAAEGAARSPRALAAE